MTPEAMEEISSTGGDGVARAGGGPRFNVARWRDFAVVAVVVVLFIILSASSSVFLTKDNLFNIWDQWAAIGIVAVAVTLVLITGGFDLSVAATYSLASVIAAKTATSVGPQAGLLIGLGVAVAVGVLNGFAVVVLRINAIIATLASGFIVAGAALQISNGTLISVTDQSFGDIGRWTFLGATSIAWVFALWAVGFAFLLHKTVFGRRVYAVGGNRAAARLAGVRTGAVLFSVYILSALSAGLAGVLETSRQSTGQAEAVPDLVFTVIAAIVVGGTSVLGGAGAIWRTIVGLALLALIQNGGNLLGISITFQEMIFGAIILIAAASDVLARGGESGT